MAALYRIGDYELGQTNNIYLTKDSVSITPAIIVNAMDVANREGMDVVEQKFGNKVITVSGLVYDNDKSSLESRLATFKKNLIVQDEYFYFTYNGKTMKYSVYTTSLTVKDEYTENVKEFTVEFTAYDPPFALEDSSTNAKTATITSQIYNDNVTIEGTAEAKPVIKFTFTNADSLTGIEFINRTNGSRIEIDTSFVNGDVLKIDADALEVKLNGDDQAYSGMIPEFDEGNNDIVVNAYTSGGIVLSQYNTLWNKKYTVYGANKKVAQSFQVGSNAIVPRVDLIIEKVGNPTTDVTVRIETDSSAKPSGTLVTNATTTISKDSIKDVPTFISALFSVLPSISATTTYHIVVSTSGGDSDNYYKVAYNDSSNYASGQVSRMTDGSTWVSKATYDLAFKVFITTIDVNNQDIDNSYSENFSATTKRDAPNTTADWNTTLGWLKLAIANAMSFGSSSNFYASSNSNRSYYVAYDSYNHRVVATYSIVYASGPNYINEVRCVVGTVSGTSISWGSPVVVDTNTYGYSSFLLDPSCICFDSYNNKIVLFWRNIASGYKLRSAVGTVSGSSISFGSTVDVHSDANWIFWDATCNFDSTNNKVAVFYSSSYSGSYKLQSKVGTVSGSSISFGSVVDITTNNATPSKSVYTSSSKSVLFFRDATASKLKSVVGTISGTSISFGTIYDVTSYNASGGMVTYDTANSKLVYAYYDITDSYKLKTRSGSISGTVISFGTEATFFTGTSGAYLSGICFDTNYSKIILASKDKDNSDGYIFVGYVSGTDVIFGSQSTFYSAADVSYYDVCFDNYTNQEIVIFQDNSSKYGKAKVGYLSLDTVNNVGRSIDLATVNFGVIAGKISKTDSTPTGTSISYSLSNDGGSSFESIDIDIWKVFSTLISTNKNIRFKAELSGTTLLTPYVDTLITYYKLGGILNTTNMRMRQSFKPGFSGNLARINLWLMKKGSPGNLTVELYANSGGNPTGAALASQVISSSDISSSFPNKVTCNFDTPYSVTSGTTYHIVIKGASVDSSNLYCWTVMPGNLYANGDAGYSSDGGSSWSTEANYDFSFEVYSSSLAFSISMLIDYVKRWLL